MRRQLVSALKQLRPDPRADARRVIVELAAHRASQRTLNVAVERLPKRGQEWFQREFALALMGECRDFAPGAWKMRFAGQVIRVTLVDDVAQRWNFALSVKGHDTEVKDLYVRLLQEGQLRTFYDIGTNFGTHSLPLLVHGVRVISVEPNPTCHVLFEELCIENGVMPDLRKVALGTDSGWVRLAYPIGETWLGTLSQEVESDLSKGHAMASVEVEMTTLDQMIASGDPLPDLIKVDTEGHDVAVLRGGVRLLSEHQPLIVFEAWRPEERPALADLLREIGYRVARPSDQQAIGWDDFQKSTEGNFLAVPASRAALTGE